MPGNTHYQSVLSFKDHAPKKYYKTTNTLFQVKLWFDMGLSTPSFWRTDYLESGKDGIISKIIKI